MKINIIHSHQPLLHPRQPLLHLLSRSFKLKTQCFIYFCSRIFGSQTDLMEAKQIQWKQSISGRRQAYPVEEKHILWKQSRSSGRQAYPVKAEQFLWKTSISGGSRAEHVEARQDSGLLPKILFCFHRICFASTGYALLP